MCGRLACGLNPQDVCNSCCYKPKGQDSYVRPDWRNVSNSGFTYKPSYNICPKDVAPVILSGTHFQSDNRIIAPMIFGVIPHWTEVNEKSTYSTINCRIETMKTSNLYKTLLSKRQRCVIVCSGFYEWKKQNKNKKPYFIHNNQPDNVQISEPETWKVEFSEKEGYNGVRLLKLAGLFEKNHSGMVEEMTLSFTIITKAASSDMIWLHDRMPVTFETDQQIDAWLNRDIDTDQALACLSMKDNFMYYPVSNAVSSVRNKEITCIKPESEDEKKDAKSKSADMMKNWLQSGQKRKSGESGNEIFQKVKK